MLYILELNKEITLNIIWTISNKIGNGSFREHKIGSFKRDGKRWESCLGQNIKKEWPFSEVNFSFTLYFKGI